MNWLYRTTLLTLALLGALACTRDDVDVDGLTNFAPAILPGNIADGGSVVRGDFGITVYFADGTTSPLTSGTVALRDSAGVELFATTQALEGTRDSIVVAGSAFGAADLGLGAYELYVSATDNAGQTTEETFAFTISALPFPANLTQLFVAGAFNGWSADSAELFEEYAFELVSANTWEISGIDLQGQEWKLKNTVNWTDLDWGDGDCDGVMTQSPNAPNTGCGSSGRSTIRFNDETLAYEVIPEVSLATNLEGLFLVGTFDGVTNALGEGDTYEFELIGDNQWDLPEVTLRPGDRFKFAETANLRGRQFGDDDYALGASNVAEPDGAVIALPDDFEAGVYAIAFDDETLEYSIDFLRDAGFRSIGLLGVGVVGSNGFAGPDLDLRDDDGDGVWTYEGLVVDSSDVGADDGNLRVKFRADDAWDVNWGGGDFPAGTATMGGPDIPVREGTYDVTFVPATGEYNFEARAQSFGSIGILGTALPGGFDTDSDYDLIDPDEDGTYEIVVGLKDGEVKFRADDAWDVSWGSMDFPVGTGSTDGGPDIPVTAGLYYVRFTPATGAYEFAETSVGIIGDATSGAWDDDTDLTFDPSRDDANVLTLTITLGEGAVKFRTADSWDNPFDWGGTEFPDGVGVRKGSDNIPSTPGDYAVSFNVLTYEYSFE